MKKNRLGNLSLALAVCFMTIGLVFKKLHLYEGDLLEILLAGFEAAVVGGVADWFAVRALFQEIPIPYVKRHTNIIVKSREKLSAGIVDLVNNEWLSKEMLRDKIEGISLAKPILEYLMDGGNQTAIQQTLKPELEALLLQLDAPNVVSGLEDLLRPACKGNNIAEPLGRFLKQVVEHKEHYGMLKVFLEVLKEKIADPATLEFLTTEVEFQVKNQKKKGSVLKGVLVGAGQILGAIKPSKIAKGIQEQLYELIEEMHESPEDHKIIQALDRQLYEYGDRLTSEDDPAIETINEFGEQFLLRLIDSGMVKQALTRVKGIIHEQVFLGETEHTQLLKDKVNRMLHGFYNDVSKLERTDAWLKSTLLEVIDKHHHRIGELVGESLAKLSNFELVKQIEEKVGEDLQYIRLNGALVGGLVGMLIMVFKIYILDVHS
ncbi:DUF445 domain-containing protein [Mangrovimonas sp. DI 80]|uniref:DUF445 domain-containing protein n=1 Tax=Mangrovimonas sp. DI 80 TaxID=1779330 RepID=UPI00097691EB|nr:DUF445 domain-containing protein [Mangrovimonas sp. DI 80]OMP30358.1 hypothetical protein BKM32_13330 [Mangrovimonas sp. DI 80]